MGMVRMECKRKFSILNEQGQSTVEYILLIAVSISLVYMVFTSGPFEGMFGDKGQFATVFKSEIEYSYRHALGGRKPYRTPSYSGGNHDSYKNGSETRFFGAKDKYPTQ